MSDGVHRPYPDRGRKTWGEALPEHGDVEKDGAFAPRERHPDGRDRRALEPRRNARLTLCENVGAGADLEPDPVGAGDGELHLADAVLVGRSGPVRADGARSRGHIEGLTR